MALGALKLDLHYTETAIKVSAVSMPPPSNSTIVEVSFCLVYTIDTSICCRLFMFATQASSSRPSRPNNLHLLCQAAIPCADVWHGAVA